ncbi:IreB family regulatory phosphoprotein [Fructilactobacillus fructivorans]|nr:IreB family regulatory phosphoprotein [Fructilactobacillus fructivorans]KID41552.1 hypothetical protein LfDm3_0794 [Fructilactobacillus fructivorans]
MEHKQEDVSLFEDKSNLDIHKTLATVYQALIEKGYDPYVQLVGYLTSGDPAYLPKLNNARTLMCHYDREEIIDVLLHSYLKGKTPSMDRTADQ